MARRSIEKAEERLKERIAEAEARIAIQQREIERHQIKLAALRDALEDIQSPAPENGEAE